MDPALVAVSLGHLTTHWYPSTLYVVLPYLAKDLGLSYSQVGFLMGWNYFTSFFVNLPGGLIVDVVGKTRLLLGFSLALVGVPYCFLGFSTSYLTALAIITFVGTGSNLWHPGAISFLAKRFPNRKGFAIAFHDVGGMIGSTLAPMAIGFALTYLIWRKVMVLNLLIGILVGLIVWRLLAGAGKVEREKKGKGPALREYWGMIKAIARNRNVFLLCCLAGMRSMTSQGLFTFLPIYLAHELGYSPALVGTSMAVVQVAGIFSSPVSGVLSDRKGRRPVLTAGLLTTSLLLVAVVLFRLHFLFIGVLAFQGFFLFSLHPVLFAWTMDLTPRDVSGTMVSFLTGVSSLFSGSSPIICGFIADHFGIMYAFYFLAFTILAANVIVYLVPEKARPESEALLPRL